MAHATYLTRLSMSVQPIVLPLQLASQQLLEKGEGIRFEIPHLGPHVTGFVVRYLGVAYAYINRCAHVPIELDWNPGQFFNLSQEWIICATHGAMYHPADGFCVMGPCQGRSLTAIPVTEHAGVINIHLEQL